MPTASCDTAIMTAHVAQFIVDDAEWVDLLRTIHNSLLPAGRLSSSTLRFRSEAELRESLADVGFQIETIDGGWKRDPIGHSDSEHIVMARRVT
jgi:hypothetical protein